jgi:hypothetical protein
MPRLWRCSGISLTNNVSNGFPAALSVRRISEDSLSVRELPRFRSLLDFAELNAEARESNATSIHTI